MCAQQGSRIKSVASHCVLGGLNRFNVQGGEWSYMSRDVQGVTNRIHPHLPYRAYDLYPPRGGDFGSDQGGDDLRETAGSDGIDGATLCVCTWTA